MVGSRAPSASVLMRAWLAFHQRIGTDIQCLHILLEGVEGRHHICGATNAKHVNFEAEGAGGGLRLHDLQLAALVGDIGDDCEPPQIGKQLAQDFEPLASDIGCLGREAGNVSPRLRQACDKPDTERVYRNWKYNGDGRRFLSRGFDPASYSDNHIDLQADEFGGDCGEKLGSSVRPTVLDRQVTALGPAQFPKALHEGRSPRAPIGLRAHAKKADGG
jgi:hypothetical protein